MQATSERLFTASYDLPTTIVSTVVCATPVALAAYMHSWIVAAVALFGILLAYGFSPRAYLVAGETVRVQRLIGAAVIPLRAVGDARRATRDDFRGCIKLFGSGGLFGYYGLYRTSSLGKSTWYLTSRSKAVVLHTGGKTSLFSPDDTEGFLEALQAGMDSAIATGMATGMATGSATGSALSDGSTLPRGVPPEARVDEETRGLMGLLAGGLIGFAVIALVASAVLYAPGPPRYTLTPKSLTIHDRFYPVTLQMESVDAGKIRIVDVSWEKEWQPVARTNGFANGHYRAGWFRLANGTKVRLYRATGAQLVLLPAKGNGTTVLLEAADPTEFLRQIREAWTR